MKAIKFAEKPGLTEAGKLLTETLNEEKAADQKLTEVALQGVNMEAASEQTQEYQIKGNIMNKHFKGALAGCGAMKSGGGCLGTIIVFIAIWLHPGMCS